MGRIRCLNAAPFALALHTIATIRSSATAVVATRRSCRIRTACSAQGYVRRSGPELKPNLVASDAPLPIVGATKARFRPIGRYGLGYGPPNSGLREALRNKDFSYSMAERVSKLVYLALIRERSPTFKKHMRHRRELCAEPHVRSLQFACNLHADIGRISAKSFDGRLG